MIALSDVTDVLGLPGRSAPRTPIGLVARIEDGLPLAALERVAGIVAPGDLQFKYRLVPRATYERRKDKNLLSPDEGMRLTRLARVWGVALDVWKSEGDARDFLFRPHAMIEDKRPIDLVIQSEFGAELVTDILGGLKYGSAA